MKSQRKQRLALLLLLLICLGAAAAFVGLALKQNINLFFTPSQIVAGEAPEKTRFRVGGMVVEDSVSRGSASDGLTVSFGLTDQAQTVTVKYTGILPDLFREGQGIVAQGTVKNGVFMAEEVLAKHDENYMPPEAAEAIRQANAAKYNPDKTATPN